HYWQEYPGCYAPGLVRVDREPPLLNPEPAAPVSERAQCRNDDALLSSNQRKFGLALPWNLHLLVLLERLHNDSQPTPMHHGVGERCPACAQAWQARLVHREPPPFHSFSRPRYTRQGRYADLLSLRAAPPSQDAQEPGPGAGGPVLLYAHTRYVH